MNMDSRYYSDERHAYPLSSTYSPWRSDEPADTAPGNRPQLLVVDDDMSLGRRSSSAFYSPQSLHSTSPATIREQTISRDCIPSHTIISQPRCSESAASPETDSGLSTVGGSSPPPPTEQSSIPPISNVLARRSAAIMPTHPGAESIPMSAMYNPTPSPSIMISEDEGDREITSPPHTKSNFGCYSRQDVYIGRWSWLYVTLIFLSIYSTAFSGLWLVVSIVQPTYGRSISTGNGWQLTPSTATLLAVLAAKTIELSFVTVYVAVLGQVLTRRAFSRLSRGITLAEMTMRNWVIQPGSLITYWEGIPNAATTFLGALTLTVTICALFYTTASDAMISPKLKRQDWAMRDLQGLVKTPYGNPIYVRNTCQTPLRGLDSDNAPISCLDVVFSGQSYHSLITFMGEWDDINQHKNSTTRRLSDRPTGKHNLYDNTTMESSWIETEHGDMAAKFDIYNRIINNVTLAMPHAGVYAAATDPINGILQPSELLGLGEYSIRASVVSPVVNVMCSNMNEEELAPLVYTQWPNAQTETTEIPGQVRGKAGWEDAIPPISDTEWFNRTVVDDLFKWGKEYDRRPPAFQLYPIDYNMVTYASKNYTESMYILAKSPYSKDYTLCDMRSWVTPKCSTAFDLSGTSGGYMKAHCEDRDDRNAYSRVNPNAIAEPSKDWLNIAKEWALSINLSGGEQNNNASNARMLTSLIPQEPVLNPLLPSMAEALAVLGSSTIVAGSLESTFGDVWMFDVKDQIIPEGVYERIRAQVQTQQYASAHTAAWQVIFYAILGLTFILNVLCLAYLIAGTSLTTVSPSQDGRKPTSASPFSPRFPFFTRKHKTHDPIESDEEPGTYAPHAAAEEGGRAGGGRSYKSKAAKGLVTDYTEPQNLFALAVNSPPARAVAGSCGHGPDAREMAIPWRVGYAAGSNHYFFEADRRRDHGTGDPAAAASSGADLLDPDVHDGRFAKSYKRLSSRHTWL